MSMKFTREEAVRKLGDAVDLLEDVVYILTWLGATHSMVNRTESLMLKVDDLRTDAKQCDLLNESD